MNIALQPSAFRLQPFFSEAVFHTGGGGMGHNLFSIFVAILIGLIVWALGKYFFPKLGMPAVGMLIWDGLFVLIAAIFVINFLAGLVGHPLFDW